MGIILVFLGVVGVMALRVATRDLTEFNAFMEWWPLWILCAAALFVGSWLVKRNESKFTQNQGKK